MVANLEDKTLGATLSDARAKALVTMLADAQAHVGNEKLGQYSWQCRGRGTVLHISSYAVKGGNGEG